MEEKKQIIWVYGSLRKTEFNNSILEDSEYLGRGIVRGYKMFSLGSYPFVAYTGNENDKIIVEGYEVNYRVGSLIIGMELGSGYHVASVDVEIEFGSVIGGKIFAMEIIHRNCGEIPSGDWVNSKEERYIGRYYG